MESNIFYNKLFHFNDFDGKYNYDSTNQNSPIYNNIYIDDNYEIDKDQENDNYKENYFQTKSSKIICTFDNVFRIDNKIKQLYQKHENTNKFIMIKDKDKDENEINKASKVSNYSFLNYILDDKFIFNNEKNVKILSRFTNYIDFDYYQDLITLSDNVRNNDSLSKLRLNSQYFKENENDTFNNNITSNIVRLLDNTSNIIIDRELVNDELTIQRNQINIFYENPLPITLFTISSDLESLLKGIPSESFYFDWENMTFKTNNLRMFGCYRILSNKYFEYLCNYSSKIYVLIIMINHYCNIEKYYNTMLKDFFSFLNLIMIDYFKFLTDYFLIFRSKNEHLENALKMDDERIIFKFKDLLKYSNMYKNYSRNPLKDHYYESYDYSFISIITLIEYFNEVFDELIGFLNLSKLIELIKAKQIILKENNDGIEYIPLNINNEIFKILENFIDFLSIANYLFLRRDNISLMSKIKQKFYYMTNELVYKLYFIQTINALFLTEQMNFDYFLSTSFPLINLKSIPLFLHDMKTINFIYDTFKFVIRIKIDNYEAFSIISHKCQLLKKIILHYNDYSSIFTLRFINEFNKIKNIVFDQRYSLLETFIEKLEKDKKIAEIHERNEYINLILNYKINNTTDIYERQNALNDALKKKKQFEELNEINNKRKQEIIKKSMQLQHKNEQELLERTSKEALENEIVSKYKEYYHKLLKKTNEINTNIHSRNKSTRNTQKIDINKIDENINNNLTTLEDSKTIKSCIGSLISNINRLKINRNIRVDNIKNDNPIYQPNYNAAAGLKIKKEDWNFLKDSSLEDSKILSTRLNNNTVEIESMIFLQKIKNWKNDKGTFEKERLDLFNEIANINEKFNNLDIKSMISSNKNEVEIDDLISKFNKTYLNHELTFNINFHFKDEIFNKMVNVNNIDYSRDAIRNIEEVVEENITEVINDIDLCNNVEQEFSKELYLLVQIMMILQYYI